MKVLVRAHSLFQEILGKELLVEVEEGATIRDLLMRLLRGLEYRGVTPIILVNHERAGLEHVLKDKDIVDLAPPFSGG
ncbi:MAG: MoaD/ThiS family protein [Thermosphaera sp.]